MTPLLAAVASLIYGLIAITQIKRHATAHLTRQQDYQNTLRQVTNVEGVHVPTLGERQTALLIGLMIALGWPLVLLVDLGEKVINHYAVKIETPEEIQRRAKSLAIQQAELARSADLPWRCPGCDTVQYRTGELHKLPCPYDREVRP